MNPLNNCCPLYLKLNGISKVEASFNNQEVKVTYEKNIISQEEIEKTISKLD